MAKLWLPPGSDLALDLRGLPFTSKPHHGVKVNPEHPFAKHLEHCFLLQDEQWVDLVTGGLPYKAQWNLPIKTANGAYFGLSQNHVLDYRNYPIYSDSPRTLFSVFKTSATSGDVVRSLNIGDRSENDRYVTTATSVDGAFTYQVRYDADSLTVSWGTAASDTVYSMAGVSHSDSDHRLYVDGIYRNNGTTSVTIGAGIDYNAVGALLRPLEIWTTRSEIYMGYVFSTALDAMDIAALDKSPYSPHGIPLLIPEDESPIIVSYSSAEHQVGQLAVEVLESRDATVTLRPAQTAIEVLEESSSTRELRPAQTVIEVLWTEPEGGNYVVVTVNN